MNKKEKKDFRMNFWIDEVLKNDMEILKDIYNINTYTGLVRHLIKLEKLKHNIK